MFEFATNLRREIIIGTFFRMLPIDTSKNSTTYMQIPVNLFEERINLHINSKIQDLILVKISHINTMSALLNRSATAKRLRVHSPQRNYQKEHAGTFLLGFKSTRMSMSLEVFDPNESPPNWDEAIKHGVN